MDKKADKIILSQGIFMILNLIFFVILVVFVWKAGTFALVYEQAYAKQISMIIDAAKTETSVAIDFSKPIEIAKKNKISDFDNLVKIKDNQIVVSLASSGGFEMKFFSDYNVTTSVEGNFLVINIKEKIK